MKFDKSQRERISEILGNISVAWFSAGAISPLFVHPNATADVVFPIMVSFVMFGFFVILSVRLTREKK